MTPPPVAQEVEILEHQILHNDFPAYRVSAIERLIHTVTSIAQFTSHRYLPDVEIGATGDSVANLRIAEVVARTWDSIKFHVSLTPTQQEVLMELLAQHGALLEKGWLLTPKGKLRINFDPIQIKKSTET